MWTVLGSIFLSENTELFVNDDQGLFLNAGDRWGGVLPKYDSLNPPNTMLCISWLQICRQYNLSAIKKKLCTEDILEEITVNSTIKRKKGKNHGESQITVITSQNSSKWS